MLAVTKRDYQDLEIERLMKAEVAMGRGYLQAQPKHSAPRCRAQCGDGNGQGQIVGNVGAIAAAAASHQPLDC